MYQTNTPSGSYNFNPADSYLPTFRNGSYQGSSPRYEQALQEYNRMSSNLLKQGRGNYN